ncbi:hypothetical protein [Porphyromonas crevioricanis]|uniref:Uncharacterized protein n=1 Tax=Porphyromonas crevioricanis TaxID=393921 RepID=A0AB34PI32_9PORP|nr:hypothetical protein [Porphyromonas crevioricanis]KGN95026.1 hypothetical protein HQ38_04340 [Porphyromonas crevioricanis]
MNTLLLFLVVVVVCKMMLQMSFYSVRVSLIVALAYAAVPLFMHGTALMLNRLEVERMLSSSEAIGNISLLIVIDLIQTVYFCIYHQRELPTHRLKRAVAIVVSFCPSLLVLPAIAYIQLHLFFSALGVSFLFLSIGLSVVIFVVFAVSGPLLRQMLGRGGSLRSELVILLSLLIFLYTIAMGLIRHNASVAAPEMKEGYKLQDFAFTLVILFLGIAMGFIYHRLREHWQRRRSSLY